MAQQGQRAGEIQRFLAEIEGEIARQNAALADALRDADAPPAWFRRTVAFAPRARPARPAWFGAARA